MYRSLSGNAILHRATHAFECCAKLEQLSLPSTRAGPDALTTPSPPAGIPQGCFHSSGTHIVTLGADAVHIGHRAYENCKQLIMVDISNTVVRTLHMHTFSHCTKLNSVRLPPSLQEIQAEAFIAPLANSLVPSLMTHTFSRAQHLEKSRTP